MKKGIKYYLYIQAVPNLIDIKNCTILFTLLFADDSSFLISGKNLDELVEILNFELKKICDWFCCNEMSLNSQKTKFMIFDKN